jgi:hypothetical protein
MQGSDHDCYDSADSATSVEDAQGSQPALPWSGLNGEAIECKFSQVLDIEERAEEVVLAYFSSGEATCSLGPGQVDDIVRIILGWERDEWVHQLTNRMISVADPFEVLKSAPDSPPGLAAVIRRLRDTMAAAEELGCLLPRLTLLTGDTSEHLQATVDRAAELRVPLEWAEQRLAVLGWRLDDKGRLVEMPDGRRRPKLYLSRIVCLLVDYLTALRPVAGNTVDLQRDIHRLLEPVYANLTLSQVRAAIDNHLRPR